MLLADAPSAVEERANLCRSKWLADITVIRDWQSYLELPLESPELHFASDFSQGHRGFTLPLFEAAVVPDGAPAGEQSSDKSYKDVIMNAGGSVWALDWCPQRPGWPLWSQNVKQKPGTVPTYLAVGTHPAQSPFVRLGEAVSGKGLVQIWTFDFSVCGSDHQAESEINEPIPKKQRRKAGGKEAKGIEGRKGGKIASQTSKCNPEHTGESNLHQDFQSCIFGKNGNHQRYKEQERQESGGADDVDATAPVSGKLKVRLKDKARAKGPSHQSKGFVASEQAQEREQKVPTPSTLDFRLPGMVLGLAHDGLLTWDAKWRSLGVDLELNSNEREIWRLGYLAMALGNGSVEVFDVPLPGIFEVGTLFVRIEPILRCSELRSGGQRSIPLTVEWSTWAPYDLLLAGCHDGSVAVWKFDASAPAGQETRPLMSFVADVFPIRAVAWAPECSGSAGNHLIATTGHSGYVRFWDIRDPFRPIWDLQISRGWILGLNWLGNPRCLLISMDDGTLRLLNLRYTSPEFPGTGNSVGVSQNQILHSYFCSSFAIWGVQTCRTTNVVAYCGADGSVLQFQLTEKAVEKDAARNRAPHFLVGAYAANSEAGPLLIVPQQRCNPVQMKKTPTEWSSIPISKRGFLSTVNHALRARGGLFLPPLRPGVGGRTKGKSTKGIKDSAQIRQSKEVEADAETEDVDSPTAGNAPLADMPPEDEFPPKKVAIHRVRWNCNSDGSDWLAYGGSAGIVRCQKVGLHQV